MNRFFLVVFSLLFGLQLFAQPQKKMLLGGEWRFVKDSIQSNTPNDASWEKVTIPHTWNIADGQAGKGDDAWQSENSYYRGPGTYTKRFIIKKNDKKKRTFIRFEAVCQVAYVYVNGKYVGEHKGAYTAFAFDITDKLVEGENVLLVKANNTKVETIIPLGGDYTKFGGIYRKVWLLTKNNVSISPLHYGSNGVYLKQTKVSDSEFEIEATTKVLNNTNKDQEVTVQIDILNTKNEIVTKEFTTQKINLKSTESVVTKLRVKNPVLWQSTENPYLYTASIKVFHKKQILDSLSQKIGFRSFKVDPINGAFLNGKYIKLRGVNKHQDFFGKGWAISNKDLDLDMEMIKEIGANAIRLAHYPHSTYTYSLCDKYGFMIWAEIPVISSVLNTPEFHESAKTMLKEMICQNFNNPSILMWSIGNEIGHRKTDDPVPLITELNNIAHEIDPSRYTVLASNGVHVENTIPDLFGMNGYPGWYKDSPEYFEEKAIERNKTVNNKGMAMSEYGAGASIKQHQQYMTTKPEAGGKWHPENWQAIVHEIQLKQIMRNNWIWGSFAWNMFDFASAGRKEGDALGINDKGLVTYDRKVRKDAFYYYKVNWNLEPMVYITSRRHTQRDTAITNIKVYSNCEKVELFVNGIKQNNVTPDHCIYNWKNITLNAGHNEIKVIAMTGNKEITDKCEWYFVEKKL